MKVYLRALEPDDYKTISLWRNDDEVVKDLGGNKYYISMERERKWVQNVIDEDNNNLRLAIGLAETEKIIGLVNLTKIEWINRKAEFSIMLGDKSEWGKGYGREATRLMLKHGFQQLNLQKIYLYVNEQNIRARELYLKSGFKIEGLLRNNIFKYNQYQNQYVMSILKDEFIDSNSVSL